MAISKITAEEIRKAQVEGNLPDRPSQVSLYGKRAMTPEEVKAAYDKLPKLIIAYYNALVDYLTDGTGLAKIIPTGIREGHTLHDLFGDITSGSFASYLDIGDTTLEDFYLDQLERNTAIGEAEPDETLAGKVGGIYFHQKGDDLVGYVCVGTEEGKYIWKSFGSANGGTGEAGISPTVEITEIDGGHRVTITDADGPESFDVMNGKSGVWIGSPETKPDGYDIVIDPNGEADSIFAVSPTVEVSKSGSVTTLTITDANGTKTATILDGKNGVDGKDGADGKDGVDGKDGENGVSPWIYVTTIDGGHRVTISDANGTRYFDVLDGTSGTLETLFTPVITLAASTLKVVGMTSGVSKNVTFYKDGVIFTGVSGVSSDNMEYDLRSAADVWGAGTYSITVKCSASGYYDSGTSNAVDYEVIDSTPTLQTPVITLAASTLKVVGMTAGVSKNVTFYKDGVIFTGVSGVSSDNMEYDLRSVADAWGAGTYSITVKCSASGYYDSGFSNTVDYEVVDSTPTLFTPVLTIAASTLKVVGMTAGVSKNVTFYKDGVIFTGVSGITADNMEYDLRSMADAWGAGTYSITVKCTASGYYDSGTSNAVDYEVIDSTPTLQTPVITITASTLKVVGMTAGVSKNVTFYKDGVIFTGVSGVSSDNMEYDLRSVVDVWDAGTYSITVKCSASGYYDSGTSNAVDYEVIDSTPTLFTPVITLAASTLKVVGMTAGVSKNVTFYKDGVIFTGVSGVSADNMEYDLRSMADAWDAGTHSITVKCTASGYYDSGFSNAVPYVIEDDTPTLWTPVLTISGDTLKISGMTAGVSKSVTLYKDGTPFTGLTTVTSDKADYDLHTFADAWGAGTYAITVKCTASGYNASALSNAVLYTVT